jgi:hypothetical protein
MSSWVLKSRFDEGWFSTFLAPLLLMSCRPCNSRETRTAFGLPLRNKKPRILLFIPVLGRDVQPCATPNYYLLYQDICRILKHCIQTAFVIRVKGGEPKMIQINHCHSNVQDSAQSTRFAITTTNNMFEPKTFLYATSHNNFICNIMQ